MAYEIYFPSKAQGYGLDFINPDGSKRVVAYAIPDLDDAQFLQAAANNRREYTDLLVKCKNYLANPFEPDNQCALYHEIVAVLTKPEAR